VSKYEPEFLQSMSAVDELIERTENPHHRAILENYRRHVYLEVSGRLDDILAPDMTVEHPVYRISWGRGDVIVLDGADEVRAFYESLGKAGAVLWNTEEQLAVADWGFASELTLNQLVPGSAIAAEGDAVDDEDAIYHLRSRRRSSGPTTRTRG
jgi:hypothetical protein